MTSKLIPLRLGGAKLQTRAAQQAHDDWYDGKQSSELRSNAMVQQQPGDAFGRPVASNRRSAGKDQAGHTASQFVRGLQTPEEFWGLDQNAVRIAMRTYQDSMGPMMREGVHGLFRNCICATRGIKPRACIPPRPAFRCMRRCDAIKSEFVALTAASTRDLSRNA